MKAPWIRVHANLAQKPVIGRAAEALGVSRHEAIGLMVQFWGSVSVHGRRGDLSQIDDKTLEWWAGWDRGGRKRGRFAAFIRDHHVDSDGRIREWDDYAGKLEDRKEREDSPDKKSTYVYYAVVGSTCKIGWSGNPWARINDLKTAHPGIRIGAVERGTRQLERERHQQFAADHVEREWFTLSPDLLAHINDVAATKPTTVAPTVATTPRTTKPTTEATTFARARVTKRDDTRRDDVVVPQELEKSGSTGESADFDARADGFDADLQAGRRSAADLLEPTSRTVRRFWQSHYTLRSTPAERQLDTAEQLRQLHDGRPVRGPDGQYVRAYGLDRLDQKCQQILDTTLRDPDAALGYLLIALGDTSDVSRAGALPGQVEAAAFAEDDVDRSGDDFPTSIGDALDTLLTNAHTHQEKP